MRLMLQNMGGAAIKIGQQLAVRTDVLPLVYCDELEKLLDEVPPFPAEQAWAIIEQDTGKPVAETFREFDSKPIGSGSIACVYRATLITGEAVAVKIRRPHIESMLVADLKAISMLCRVSEWFGIARPGKWTPVVIELDRMLKDELTFLFEAHQIAFFRKQTKKQKIKSVTAPKVHFALCSHRIVVTSLVSGVPMRDILSAVDRNDRQRLTELKAAGYDPVRLSKKWMRFFFWELFDSVIFHADPHPGNIIVQPGNKMVLIDFGCCGCVTSQYRTNLFGVNQSVVDQDLDAMVRSTVENQEPLPPIDADAYMAELKEVLRKFLIRSKSKYVPWEDKTTSGVLREMQDISRRYNVPIKPDILRVFRATLLSDSMAYRLNPKFGASKEFSKWARKREARKRKRLLRRDPRRHPILDPLKVESFVSSLDQITSQVQKMVSRPTFLFKQSVKKLAYAVSIGIQTFNRILCLFAGFTLFRWIGRWFASSQAQASLGILDDARWTLSNYWFVGTTIVLIAIAIHKIHIRTQDIDVDSGG
jgi:ubiquinone biosynthesis protein